MTDLGDAFRRDSPKMVESLLDLTHGCSSAAVLARVAVTLSSHLFIDLHILWLGAFPVRRYLRLARRDVT